MNQGMERRLARSLKPEGAASNLDFVFNINRIKTDKNVRLDST